MSLDRLRSKFLVPSGWERSQVEGRPLTGDGKPLPWMTYGAIEFMHRVVRETDRVFEYGAGFSTLWWQQRVARVTSIEHDAEWCAQLRPQLADHVELFSIQADDAVDPDVSSELEPYFHRERKTDWTYPPDRVVRRGLQDEGFRAYAGAILRSEDSYDWIVVDGMARRLCVYAALKRVADDGVILLDNSNRSDYDLAFTLLDEEGFRQIPFWGLVPGAPFMTCTSFFIRSLDRLPSGSYGPNSFGLPQP